MGSLGTVGLAEVWSALDACLPGHRRDPKEHHWWVYPPGGGQPFRSLPKGKHGARKNPDIQRGIVRSMARQFNILPCFEKSIPGL